jgi:hypothetical protein
MRAGHRSPRRLRSPRGPLLGRTLARWFDEITNWNKAFVSNGPTEAIKNLIKRIKRIGFGFRSFAHYRIRALFYAGRPRWDLLPTITPRWGGMPASEGREKRDI